MSLREDIQHVVNCNRAENGSDTPDFILAQFLVDCLTAYDGAVAARERWYGREKQSACTIGTGLAPMGTLERDTPCTCGEDVCVAGGAVPFQHKTTCPKG
jgi:hypothetical protein